MANGPSWARPPGAPAGVTYGSQARSQGSVFGRQTFGTENTRVTAADKRKAKKDANKHAPAAKLSRSAKHDPPKRKGLFG